MSKQHITTINGVTIFAESTEQGIFIPIKPICEALGIDAKLYMLAKERTDNQPNLFEAQGIG